MICGRWNALGGGCRVFVITGVFKGCWEEVFASYRKTVACLWSTCAGRKVGAELKMGNRSKSWGHTRAYLDGEAVRYHHDDQWDEEGHEGTNQHEALLV